MVGPSSLAKCMELDGNYSGQQGIAMRGTIDNCVGKCMRYSSGSDVNRNREA